jgi:chromosome segregation ATPase
MEKTPKTPSKLEEKVSKVDEEFKALKEKRELSLAQLEQAKTNIQAIDVELNRLQGKYSQLQELIEEETKDAKGDKQ